MTQFENAKTKDLLKQIHSLVSNQNALNERKSKEIQQNVFHNTLSGTEVNFFISAAYPPSLNMTITNENVFWTDIMKFSAHLKDDNSFGITFSVANGGTQKDAQEPLVLECLANALTNTNLLAKDINKNPCFYKEWIEMNTADAKLHKALDKERKLEIRTIKLQHHEAPLKQLN